MDWTLWLDVTSRICIALEPSLPYFFEPIQKKREDQALVLLFNRQCPQSEEQLRITTGALSRCSKGEYSGSLTRIFNECREKEGFAKNPRKRTWPKFES